MVWKAQQIDEQAAQQISQWTYEPPYDLYSGDGSAVLQEEMLENKYRVVYEGEHIIGYFCTGWAAQVPVGAALGLYEEDRLDLGIGMRPDLTGQGRGQAFFSFVLDQVQDRFPGQPLRLTVAAFNGRAIRLYEAFGFRPQHVFSRGDTVFHVMIQEA
ncbi:GNAT family N-acetyltransferase [Ectobacillus ponti]|uniref:GNAT family N-acetyltransferase n=1 Tax=Ectobacillus ponti TaxID=2961894 RepID=A0AA41XCJ6_9BACI|nr:GNAT family protein [Ectobacillus ponti]MCP8970388.1 GNAT family N-acetyltransferase [Ectobacillus ponti]